MMRFIRCNKVLYDVNRMVHEGDKNGETPNENGLVGV